MSPPTNNTGKDEPKIYEDIVTDSEV